MARELSASALISGVVIAGHGRHLVVRCEGDPYDQMRQAVTRGRRDDCCVGDRVKLRAMASDQAVIESIEPRLNCVSRSDGGRTKLLASNIDQAAIVISGDPPFSEALLMRALSVLHAQRVPALIIATKTDLHAAHARIEGRLTLYKSLGYQVVPISVTGEAEAARAALQPHLKDRCTLLLGQSGMGKSTLINLLVKDAAQATREISRALSTGRHTTSFCRMFTIDAWGNAPAMGPQAQESLIIDSPGFQLFGLAHLSSSQLMHALPDVARWLGQCRFSNCSHRDEPGCLVSEAVRRGEVDAMRLRFYRDMLAETEQPVR